MGQFGPSAALRKRGTKEKDNRYCFLKGGTPIRFKVQKPVVSAGTERRLGTNFIFVPIQNNVTICAR